MKKFCIRCIEFYQINITPHIGSVCVFVPTCSEYTKQAIVRHGVFKGSFLGIKRILRCHPFQKKHIDPVS